VGAVRKQLSFIITAILTAFALAALCGSLVADCISILRNGWGTERYLAAGTNGKTVALVSREDNGFCLTRGTLGGELIAKRSLTIPSAGDCAAAEVYPMPDGSVLLGLYEPEGRPADNLTLYLVPAQGDATRLLSYDCEGNDSAERMANTFLSGFTERDGNLKFTLADNGEVHTYTYGSAGSGLEQAGPAYSAGVTSAAVLADGSLALGGNGVLTIKGRPVPNLPQNCIVTHLVQVGAGFFFMDSASLKVFYCDPNGTECTELFELGSFGQDESWDSLAFTETGSALILRGGRMLSLVDRHGETSLARIIYRPPVKCVLILAGLIILWLALTTAAWYLLSGRQHSYLPFAVRMGALLAVFALSAGVYLNTFVIRPMARESVSREARNTIAGAAAIMTDGEKSVVTALSGLPGGEYAAAESVAYESHAGSWRVSNGGKIPVFSRAVLSEGFRLQAVEEAVETGSAFVDDGEAFRLYLGYNGGVTQFSVSGSMLDSRIGGYSLKLARGVWVGLALLWLCAFCVLLIESRRVRKIGKAMESLSSGNADARLNMRTADEFETLAEDFNSMAEALRRQQDVQSDLTRAYLRFVPERVLRLLGKDSILAVDKQTFASHRMSAMMVWFEFPDRVYDNSTRALFDSINEVIERTAAIAVHKGGTVFNFAYNGYDVVLGGSEADAVSTAVAVRQEVLSLNEQRANAGLPPATLRIALDVGEMIIGVVGDETQMEPATISTSFTTARRLIGLAGKLEASILCTESIIKGAEGYGSRYMGKSRQGGGLVRVYEIFDGDIYEVRRSKANTGPRFSKGVLSLYSQDFAAAKKLFLELVHENPADGGARYYLYLADRLEKQPNQEISLDC